MKARPYWNPYFAGVMLGLVLLATFLVAAQGLGLLAPELVRRGDRRSLDATQRVLEDVLSWEEMPAPESASRHPLPGFVSFHPRDPICNE